MKNIFSQKNKDLTTGFTRLVKHEEVRSCFLSTPFSFLLSLIIPSYKKTSFVRTQKTSSCNTTGFTLIELMVATSIFMIIMLMALGALVVSSNSARKGQALRATMDNVNFAMDTMTRSIRMGTNYTCVVDGETIGPVPVDCPLGSLDGGGSAVAFKPAPPNPADRIVYRWVARPPLTVDDVLSHTVQRCDGEGEESCVDIVSPEVDITELKFFVNGSGAQDNGDFIQPSVYIIMKGTVTVRDEPTTFAIQTMASQRTAE